MTVFPQPKAPGIAVVPPCTQLNFISKMQHVGTPDIREKGVENTLSGQ